MALRTNSTSSTGRAIRYPTTPPPLRREDIIDFGNRRRLAGRTLQEAQAARQRGRGRATLEFDEFKQRLRRDTGRQTSGLRSDYGARGLAYSPAGLGKGMRTLRDTQADSLAGGQRDFADQLAYLDESVNQARLERDRELAAIGADTARRRTDLDRLINTIGL